ncbi:hypothetical protein AGMMS50229_11440 [Campylobacterota bacterium]|nr:hypothetical protein AGMMS50229_11440 [Campylobacterota bacterium]
MALNVRVFRFNAQHDYLPSYQPFSFPNSRHFGTIGDLLSAVAGVDPLFMQEFGALHGVRVNGIGARIGDEVRSFGKELVIEPLLPRRAVLDLLIDTSDFESKAEIFGDLADANDLNYYRAFAIPYYLSPTLELNSNYLGEAAFMLADRLIAGNPEAKLQILKIVCDEKNGIFNFVSLEGLIAHDEAHKIAAAVKRLRASAIALKLGIDAELPITLSDLALLRPLNGRSVALVSDHSAFGETPKLDALADRVRSLGAVLVNLPPLAVSGYGYSQTDRELAFRAAKTLLLAAVDAGADTIVCAAKEVREFLQTNKRAIIGATPIAIDIA